MEMKNKLNPTFLAQVASDIGARFGPDLRKVAIVFNNQRPVQYLNKELGDFFGRAFWSPRFFTIQEFFRTSTPRKEINATAQLFLLNELHTALQRKTNPGFEESLDHFFPLAEIILNDFAQLDYELVNVDVIFQELSSMAELDRQFDYLTEEQREFLMRFWSAFSPDQHTEMQTRFLHLWRLLPQLYILFKEALIQRDQHTIAGIYRDLVEQKPGVRDPASEFDQVLFVGFNALNACETHLFKRWQEEGKALFYFDADSYYLDDVQMEAGLFIRQNIHEHGLINAMGEVPSVLATGQGAGKIRLIAAPGYTAQAKLLHELLKENTSSAAVILADESLLVPVLQSIPENQEINITMGYPMSESLTYTFFNLFLEAQLFYVSKQGRHATEIDHRIVLDFIGHPFVECPAETRTKLMQNLAEQNHPRLHLDWVDTYLPDQASLFPDFFRPAKSVKKLLSALLDLIDNLVQLPMMAKRQYVMESSLTEKAPQTFRQLELGFESYPNLSINLAIRLIRRQLHQVTATLSGEPLKGLQIMGLLESRNLNFDTIYILGANEGNMPTLQSSATFIPYNLRRAYKLPVMDNQQALSAYLFYRLLHRFDGIDVIYDGVISEQSNGEITRFARQIQYESKFNIQEVEVAIKAVKERNADEVMPKLEPIKIPKTGKVWEKLSKYLADTPEEHRKSLSASAFSMYVNSPLEFFFRYIAGIKEPPKLSTELEANRLGNVIHHVMESAYQSFLVKKEPITPEKIEVLKDQMPSLCAQAIGKEFHPHRPDWKVDNFSAQEKIMWRISVEYCMLYLQHDKNLSSPIHLLEMENKVDFLFDFPISVQQQADSVLLKGIIDRVDMVNGKKRIVDYKTGRDELEVKGESLDNDGNPIFKYFNGDWKNSNKAFIQTMFYTYIYEQIRGVSDVEPNVYSAQKIRTGDTSFHVKVPYQPTYPVEGDLLALAKADFLVFLREKLGELFNPDIPFEHPRDATVYDSSVYAAYLNSAVDFGDDDGIEGAFAIS